MTFCRSYLNCCFNMLIDWCKGSFINEAYPYRLRWLALLVVVDDFYDITILSYLFLNAILFTNNYSYFILKNLFTSFLTYYILNLIKKSILTSLSSNLFFTFRTLPLFFIFRLLHYPTYFPFIFLLFMFILQFLYKKFLTYINFCYPFQ